MEIDRKQSVDSESAILVGVQLADSPPLSEEPLEELAGLVESAGADDRRPPDPATRKPPDIATYVGKGKLEQLDADGQARPMRTSLSSTTTSRPPRSATWSRPPKAKVLDRTELILDIFSTRAQTHEARLAVELAQLEYSLPRLKRMWTHLSRLKMGVGMRGPGEKQLETDRRLVEKRIADLKEATSTRCSTARSARSPRAATG